LVDQAGFDRFQCTLSMLGLLFGTRIELVALHVLYSLFAISVLTSSAPLLAQLN
jgi:hypothetical protein